MNPVDSYLLLKTDLFKRNLIRSFEYARNWLNFPVLKL